MHNTASSLSLTCPERVAGWPPAQGEVEQLQHCGFLAQQRSAHELLIVVLDTASAVLSS